MPDSNVLIISVCIALVVVLLMNMLSNPKQKRRRHRTVLNYPPQDYNMFDMSSYDDSEELDDQYLPDRQRGALIAQSMPSDYYSYMQKNALEPEIFSSHSRYAKDLNALNLGPSNIAERSDRGDIIPWVGLRPTNYRSVYADSEARQTHSQDPYNMPSVRSYTLEV